MKKFKWLFSILFIVAFSMCFVACGSNEQGNGNQGNGGSGGGSTPPAHVHSFTERVVADCLKTPADCENSAEYYVSCECGEKGTATFESGSPLGHTGGKATCEELAQCSRCGKTYGDYGEHEYGKFTVISEKTCTTRGEKVATCKVCHKTNTIYTAPSHEYNDEDWVTVAEPRCFDVGVKQVICNECGKVVTQTIPAIGHHDLASPTCEHGNVCIRCHYEEGEKLGHDFSNWEIKTGNEPTCTENGVKERVCHRCNKQETGVAYKTGHQGEWVTTIEPTCTTKGQKTRTCSVCNQTETSNISTLPHDYDKTIVKQATCTQNGTEKYTCKNCGYSYNMTIPATHDYYDWITESEATCQTTGLKTRDCKKCNHKDTYTIPKLNHKYDEGEVLSQPTCTENGVRKQTCTVCNQTINNTIPKLGHNMQAGTCTTPSTCSRCDYQIPGSHSYGEWKVIEDPDCDRKGYKVRVCTVCENIDRINIDPIGHTYGEWTKIVEATCEEDGFSRHICTVCGKKEDQTDYKFGHNFTTWFNDVEATCLTDGEQTRHCTRCDKFERNIIPSFGGHDFGNGGCYSGKACANCGMISSMHTYGENGCDICGLKYTDASYYNNGQSYIVEDILDKSAEIIFIRKTYNGKPVTSVSVSTLPDTATTYILPEGVESVRSFSAKNLKILVIPASIGRIPDNFAAGAPLESVIIPEGITRIGRYAFSGAKMTSVVIPNSVTTIDPHAFSGCINLKTVIIGNGVTTLQYRLFDTCKKLENVYIGDGVTTINEEVFYNCNSSFSITLGRNVTTINRNAFKTYYENYNIEFNIKDVANWYNEWPTLIRNLQIKHTVKFNGFDPTSITVPEDLEIIDSYTFNDFDNLTNIIIPVSVTRINSYSIISCDKLKEITYLGTVEQWNAITKGSSWAIPYAFGGSLTIHCLDGDVTVTRDS